MSVSPGARGPERAVASPNGPGVPAGPPEEYLSIAELAQRIPYAPQTIRNLMTQGVFRRDEHYLKPRGRIIFKWSAIQAWLAEPR